MKRRSRDTVAKNSRANVRVDVRFGSKADMCGAKRDVRQMPNSDIGARVKQAYPYLEVASGSIPLFLIVSEARAEARNSISRLEPSMSPEPATTAAENV